MRCAIILATIILIGCQGPAPPPEDWATLREPYAYDGDTLYITMIGVPTSLADAAIRVRGVDTPEIRGDCEQEKALALKARDQVRAMVAAGAVAFIDPEWDKYGGRVLATVMVDGKDLADTLIALGLGRSYGGGKRHPWCL